MNIALLVMAIVATVAISAALVMTAWLFFVAGVQAGGRAARQADEQEADIVYVYHARSPIDGLEINRDGEVA